MTKHNFRELTIWKRSTQLAIDLYKLSADFPNDEKYGLTSQVKRSVISIPSNIAEGSGRGSNKEFSRFLKISMSSAYELETQLFLASQLFNLDHTRLENLQNELNEIQKMIFVFEKSISKDIN